MKHKFTFYYTCVRLQCDFSILVRRGGYDKYEFIAIEEDWSHTAGRRIKFAWRQSLDSWNFFSEISVFRISSNNVKVNPVTSWNKYNPTEWIFPSNFRQFTHLHWNKLYPFQEILFFPFPQLDIFNNIWIRYFNHKIAEASIWESEFGLLWGNFFAGLFAGLAGLLSPASLSPARSPVKGTEWESETLDGENLGESFFANKTELEKFYFLFFWLEKTTICGHHPMPHQKNLRNGPVGTWEIKNASLHTSSGEGYSADSIEKIPGSQVGWEEVREGGEGEERRRVRSKSTVESTAKSVIEVETRRGHEWSAKDFPESVREIIVSSSSVIKALAWTSPCQVATSSFVGSQKNSRSSPSFMEL